MTREEQIHHLKREQYIGDGVYVSFDGHQLWLRTHGSRERIALEPAVWENLINFKTSLDAAIRALPPAS